MAEEKQRKGDEDIEEKKTRIKRKARNGEDSERRESMKTKQSDVTFTAAVEIETPHLLCFVPFQAPLACKWMKR